MTAEPGLAQNALYLFVPTMATASVKGLKCSATCGGSGP